MGGFHTTFVLLKNKQEVKPFLLDFHKKLKRINVLLEKDEHEIVCFNDSKEEEKEHIYLDENKTDEEIIDLICSWKALALVSYRHPDFRFPFSINYLTWDEETIQGIDIGFYDKEFRTIEADETHQKFIYEVAGLLDYDFFVGDFENPLLYFKIDKNLDAIKEFVKNKKYTIDSRS
jgi:hypothetical protein